MANTICKLGQINAIGSALEKIIIGIRLRTLNGLKDINMNYDDWKVKVEEIFKKMQSADTPYETVPYFPKSQNFMPVVTPSFKINDHLYSVKSRRLTSIEELETFLETTENVALYYVAIAINSKAPIVRYTIVEKEPLTGMTVDEFVKSFPENQKLNEYNKLYGTVDGLRSQMSGILEIGEIYCLTNINSNGVNPTSMRLDRIVTDGRLIYR